MKNFPTTNLHFTVATSWESDTTWIVCWQDAFVSQSKWLLQDSLENHKMKQPKAEPPPGSWSRTGSQQVFCSTIGGLKNVHLNVTWLFLQDQKKNLIWWGSNVPDHIPFSVCLKVFQLPRTFCRSWDLGKFNTLLSRSQCREEWFEASNPSPRQTRPWPCRGRKTPLVGNYDGEIISIERISTRVTATVEPSCWSRSPSWQVVNLFTWGMQQTGVVRSVAQFTNSFVRPVLTCLQKKGLWPRVFGKVSFYTAAGWILGKTKVMIRLNLSQFW